MRGIPVPHALDESLGIPQQTAEPAAQAYGLPGGCAGGLPGGCTRDLLKLSAMRGQLTLQTGNLETGLVALARDLPSILGGGQELAVLLV
jgi:hypothetical protein